jgi:MSHA biogenesis protein MshM
MSLYLPHFGLHEAPFGLTPDTGFLYAHPGHREALATLSIALAEGDGFVKITGEVGTGKTLLCRALLQGITGPVAASDSGPANGPGACAYLPNPVLTPRQALRALCQEMGLPTPERLSAGELQERLHAALIARAQVGQRPLLLCIDDAQAMPLATLEALRLLSNLESGKHKLMQVVLFGQPELDALLAQPACRSLASRIGFASRLSGLARTDFERYLQHRMVVAGWKGEPVFSPLACTLLHWGSRGIPRRANVMAHKALMLAYGQGRHRVGLREAWAAWRDSRLPAAAAPALGAPTAVAGVAG